MTCTGCDRSNTAAIKTLERLGYTYHGGEEWKSPLGKSPETVAVSIDYNYKGHSISKYHCPKCNAYDLTCGINPEYVICKDCGKIDVKLLDEQYVRILLHMDENGIKNADRYGKWIVLQCYSNAVKISLFGNSLYHLYKCSLCGTFYIHEKISSVKRCPECKALMVL